MKTKLTVNFSLPLQTVASNQIAPYFGNIELHIETLNLKIATATSSAKRQSTKKIDFDGQRK